MRSKLAVLILLFGSFVAAPVAAQPNFDFTVKLKNVIGFGLTMTVGAMIYYYHQIWDISKSAQVPCQFENLSIAPSSIAVTPNAIPKTHLTQIKFCLHTAVGNLCDGVFFDSTLLTCEIKNSHLMSHFRNLGIVVSCIDVGLLESRINSSSSPDDIRKLLSEGLDFQLSLSDLTPCEPVDSEGRLPHSGMPNEPYASSAKVFKQNNQWQIACFKSLW